MPRVAWKVLLVVFSLSVFNLSRSLLAEDKPPPPGQRVFVAGHSFHMPIITPLGQIAKLAGIEGHALAGSQSIGGSTVTQHWARPDDKNMAKQILSAGKADVLTLSPHFVIPDPAIDRFTDLMLQHNPNGRVLVQMSWLPHVAALEFTLNYKEGNRDATDLAELRKVTGPLADKQRAQLKAINERLAEQAKRQVVYFVPTGDALYRLRERIATGKVPAIPKQSLLFSDAFGHGKPVVGIMNAYCHYAVIYGCSPIGLPAPDALVKANLGDQASDVNRVLQECAWEAVTNEVLSGVKGK